MADKIQFYPAAGATVAAKEKKNYYGIPTALGVSALGTAGAATWGFFKKADVDSFSRSFANEIFDQYATTLNTSVKKLIESNEGEYNKTQAMGKEFFSNYKDGTINLETEAFKNSQLEIAADKKLTQQKEQIEAQIKKLADENEAKKKYLTETKGLSSKEKRRAANLIENKTQQIQNHIESLKQIEGKNLLEYANSVLSGNDTKQIDEFKALMNSAKEDLGKLYSKERFEKTLNFMKKENAIKYGKMGLIYSTILGVGLALISATSSANSQNRQRS